MGTRTVENLFTAFVGEAKAFFRLRAYARRAEAEDLPSVALLFRAIAHAESIHAENHLRLLGDAVVGSTEENLQRSFDRESTVAAVTYVDYLRQAEEEGDERAARSFGLARDAEANHRDLYKTAMECTLEDEVCAYYVCKVCGYVSKTPLEEGCPVCGAGTAAWTLID